MRKQAEVKALITDAMDRAKKADRKHFAAKRRLAKFALWKRILFYRKFNFLRFEANTQSWLRLFAMKEALHLAKVVRTMERRGLE